MKFLPLEYEKSLYLLLQKKEKKIFMAINSVNIFVRRGDVRFSNGGYCIKKKKSMAVAIFNRVSGELGIHNLPAKKNLNGRQLEEIEAYGKQISAPIRKGEAFREDMRRLVLQRIDVREKLGRKKLKKQKEPVFVSLSQILVAAKNIAFTSELLQNSCNKSDIRAEAAKALGEIGKGRKARKVLAEALRKEADLEIKKLIEEGLKKTKEKIVKRERFLLGPLANMTKSEINK